MKKNIIIKIASVSILTFLVVACNPKFKVPDAQKGDLDVSNYVALGSSATAGVEDGALYYEAQQNSYANLLAKQFEEIGGTEFTIPYTSQNSNGVGFNLSNPSLLFAKSMLAMKTDCKGVEALGPLKLTLNENNSFFNNTPSKFHNLAVPNCKAIHLLAKGYGNVASNYYNPFYQRMAVNANTGSIINDAIKQNPSFFSLMIGSDDVMAYALAGGSADTITNVARFAAHIDSVLYYLTKNGAKGVIAGIPSLHALPYFSTIAYNALAINDDSKIVTLNQFYYNLDTTMIFINGNNAFVIQDLSVPNIFLRQVKQGEYILLNLPLDDVKCNSVGSLIPIDEKYVLTLSEINNIENAIINFNSILRSRAESKGLAYVDVNSFYTRNKENFIYNGITMNYTFVKGGLFSLDGLNLTPRGNALLANEFIKSINQKYNSTIKQLDATKFRGIVFP